MAIALTRTKFVIESARKRLGLPKGVPCMTNGAYRLGDVVIVNTPDNHILDGLVGYVKGEEQTRRGLVIVVAHRVYRPGKLPEEVEFRIEADSLTPMQPKVIHNYTVLRATVEKVEEPKQELREMTGRAFKSEESAKGYTGDVCGKCGGSRMRRNGSCLLCDDCGDTTGCS